MGLLSLTRMPVHASTIITIVVRKPVMSGTCWQAQSDLLFSIGARVLGVLAVLLRVRSVNYSPAINIISHIALFLSPQFAVECY